MLEKMHGRLGTFNTGYSSRLPFLDFLFASRNQTALTQKCLPASLPHGLQHERFVQRPCHTLGPACLACPAVVLLGRERARMERYVSARTALCHSGCALPLYIMQRPRHQGPGAEAWPYAEQCRAGFAVAARQQGGACGGACVCRRGLWLWD